MVRLLEELLRELAAELGIKKEHLRLRDHEPAELAFYSRATTDIEYAFPFTDWASCGALQTALTTT